MHICIYVYIYIYRERERETTYISEVVRQSMLVLLPFRATDLIVLLLSSSSVLSSFILAIFYPPVK